MTEFESAFLCGLIKEHRPRKIVEVGVAAGGTTAILLRCLEQLGMTEKTEMFSVDLSEQFYRGSGERSGYLADDILARNDIAFRHRFLFGKLIPEVIEEIGDGIDFLILDTVHVLPGEVLDFLVAFPYLARNACVILHDIAHNHYENGLPESIATQVLLSSVVADKIIMKDENRPSEYPNIGAFIVNEDTKKYISGVFNALIITWQYMLDVHQKEVYLREYRKHYGEELAHMFLCICQLQEALTVKCKAEAIKREAVSELRFQRLRDLYEHSYSYQLGHALLWLPRKIKAFLTRSRNC